MDSQLAMSRARRINWLGIRIILTRNQFAFNRGIDSSFSSWLLKSTLGGSRRYDTYGLRSSESSTFSRT